METLFSLPLGQGQAILEPCGSPVASRRHDSAVAPGASTTRTPAGPRRHHSVLAQILGSGRAESWPCSRCSRRRCSERDCKNVHGLMDRAADVVSEQLDGLDGHAAEDPFVCEGERAGRPERGGGSPPGGSTSVRVATGRPSENATATSVPRAAISVKATGAVWFRRKTKCWALGRRHSSSWPSPSGAGWSSRLPGREPIRTAWGSPTSAGRSPPAGAWRAARSPPRAAWHSSL